ncbi:MAG: hypothetical protein IKK02_06330 [Tidjanibacter sp.]|nr:hypothetical protein [Tidjanibacter sp.]
MDRSKLHEHFTAFFPDKFGDKGSIPQETQTKWLDIINTEYNRLKDLSFDEMTEEIALLAIDGIESDIIIQTAEIIANRENANMATDKACSVVFMMRGINK